MGEIIQAFILIFLAEMGDKTQILAMTFATKYPVKKVLLGIGIGAFLNHGLAVLLGSIIGSNFPVTQVQILAGALFVLFALWSLKPEDEEEEESQSSHRGAILTVAFAFFIGELGDKTQLTAITLATTAQHPPLILVGTVLGMLATGSLGIIVGRTLGNKIPAFFMNIASSLIFFIFGTLKLYHSLDSKWLTPLNGVLYFSILAVIGLILLKPQLKRRKEGYQTAYEKSAKKLYQYYQHLQSDFDLFCQGEALCGVCRGDQCMIGHSKNVVTHILDSEETQTLLKDQSTLYVPQLESKLVAVHLEELNTFLEETPELENKDQSVLEQIKAYMEILEQNESK